MCSGSEVTDRSASWLASPAGLGVILQIGLHGAGERVGAPNAEHCAKEPNDAIDDPCGGSNESEAHEQHDEAVSIAFGHCSPLSLP